MSAISDRSTVHVAMLGPSRRYAVPYLLEKAGMLGSFYTGVYLGNKPVLRSLLASLPAALKPQLLQRFEGRFCEGLSPDKVVSLDWLGLKIHWQLRGAGSSSEMDALFARTNKAFCDAVIRRGLPGGMAVYANKETALEIFQEARQRGMFCILEQFHPPKRLETELLREELERWPGWEPGLIVESGDDPQVVREEAEWALADRIICPCEFVRQGLQSLHVDPAQCDVVPYGIPAHHFQPRDQRVPPDGLNVLFVGQGCLRKGVPYLLEAIRRLNSPHIRCRVAGDMALDRNKLSAYGRWVQFLGHVTASHLSELYRWADVFAFPSLYEGFALVQVEAIARGVPVIATPNAAPVARDGQEGFIIPIRDSEALAEKLDLLARDRGLLRWMSDKACERAREFTIEKYGERLITALQAACAAPAAQHLA